MKVQWKFLLSAFLIGCCSIHLWGQKNDFIKGSNFFQINERQLVETKWKYTYTLHLESNTIIHRAEDTYEYFLFFRFNYTYQQYLNGQFTKGSWRLKDNELAYQFKHIPKFEVAEANRKKLVLEFTQVNSRGTYQYHFVRVTSEDSPFVKPPNELPDVNVEAVKSPKDKKKWWVFTPNKKEKRRSKKSKPTVKKDEPYISIEVIGGGYYGGLNPVLRDYIHIKSDGRLIKEHKSQQNGLVVTKRNIPRPELEKFAEYVVAQDFFTMERIYDCQDELCQNRKKKKPMPIPLRLAIAYKDQRKVVTIPIFGQDNRRIQYIDYPPALDKIIAAIQKMALRLDPS
ncbi:MAG: hypothetical protein AAF960_15350 [Bacteroidota bacterium]